jgi:dTDP-glucose 4,6-dehydratase
MKNILVTGGAGFIGSHVIRHFLQHYPNKRIVNLDALTYAGNLANLADLADYQNYFFVKGDIADPETVWSVFRDYRIEAVIHLAAESHVDRSILDPLAFVNTNVVGTVNLLNAAREAWQDRRDVLFYHVSTDEVYGSLGESGYFYEDTPYDPRSPYSASKASSDHFVRAYGHTYRLPYVISNCSNNYGPFQFPEKLIPLMIMKLERGETLPVYGKGENVRDWLWVGDHCEAIDQIFHHGTPGETYNIGGNNEWRNIDLVRLLCQLMDEELGQAPGTSEQLISFIKDRPGHDLRYAIDATKLYRQLNWQPKKSFQEGLRETIRWYRSHPQWIEDIRNGSYMDYYNQQYVQRLEQE